MSERMVTNYKIELFILEHPDSEDMVTYLTEGAHNVLASLDYSDWLYDNADELLVTGLIELHGDRLVEPFYKAFGKEMYDGIVDTLESISLTSIYKMPESFLNSKTFCLYANKGCIIGFDSLIKDEDKLIEYYRMAAEQITFSMTEEFYCIWNKDDRVSRDILTRRFFKDLYYCYNYDMWDTIINYFKLNYLNFPEIDSGELFELIKQEEKRGNSINTIEYYIMAMDCKNISFLLSVWLLKRLFDEKYTRHFERLVFRIDYDFKKFNDHLDKKIIKKIKKIQKKNNLI